MLVVLTAVAYIAALVFVYPHFLAPFVPFDANQYWGVDLYALKTNAFAMLAWPRPVAYLTMSLAGHFGAAGALAFYTCIVLVDVALAMALFERYFLKAPIAWWVALAGSLLVFSAPGFYFNSTYAVGYAVGMLFALFGIWAWESRATGAELRALFVAGLCFVLAALAQESLAAFLLVYGVCAGFFCGPLPMQLRIGLPAIAILAGAAAVSVAHLQHAPFIIAISPLALSSVSTGVIMLAFATLCVAVAWQSGRGGIALAVAIAAVATYRWDGLPALALLFPAAVAGPLATRSRRDTTFVTAAVAALLIAVTAFGVLNARNGRERALLALQRIDRSILAGLDSQRLAVEQSHDILVLGLDNAPVHPWAHGDWLSQGLLSTRRWSVVTTPDGPRVETQQFVRPIDLAAVRFEDYDLVLAFHDDGTLAGAYRRADVQAAVHRLGLRNPSNAAIAAALRKGKPLATGAKPHPTVPPGLVVGPGGLYYPAGVQPFADAASAGRAGFYPGSKPEDCCFLAQSTTIRLVKPRGARAVAFDIEVPNFAPFAHQAERITVAFDGIPVGYRDVPVGDHTIAFDFPQPLLRERSVETTLNMSIAFVPAQLGLNTDPRTLSVILTGVSYR